ALTSSIPIVVPPYHGIEPRLSLDYNSNAPDGWVGVGWTLRGLSYLTRRSAGQGVPTYGDSDVFDLDGERLVPCGATQGSASSLAPSCRYPTPPAGTTNYTTLSEQDLVITHSVVASQPLSESWS